MVRAQLPAACAWQWEVDWQRVSHGELSGPIFEIDGRLHAWSHPGGFGLRLWRLDPELDSWAEATLPSDVALVENVGLPWNAAVATSPEEIVLFGSLLWHGLPIGGLRCDIETREWTPLTGVGAVAGRQAFWTGSVFVVFDALRRPGATWDPATDRWESLPEDSGGDRRQIWRRRRLDRNGSADRRRRLETPRIRGPALNRVKLRGPLSAPGPFSGRPPARAGWAMRCTCSRINSSGFAATAPPSQSRSPTVLRPGGASTMKSSSARIDGW